MGNDNSSTKEPEYRPIAPRKKEKRAVKYVTTVFHWPFGGKSVCIIGSFNKWKQEIPMPYNHDDRAFSVALTLRTGKHYIRYIVDDEFQVDKRLPTHHDRDGYYSNIVYIREEERNPTHLEAHDGQSSQSPDLSPVSPTGNLNVTPKGSQRNKPAFRILCISGGTEIGMTRVQNNERVKRLPNKPPVNHVYPKPSREFGKTRPNFIESRKSPPLLPPHLGYTNLNASTYDPPSGEGMDHFGPNILPLPVHVTSNHLYFFYPSPDRDPSLGRLAAYGVTCYTGSKENRKFSTIKFYTPGLVKNEIKFHKLSSLKEEKQQKNTEEEEEEEEEKNENKEEEEVVVVEEEGTSKTNKNQDDSMKCDILRIGLKGSLNGVMIRRRRPSELKIMDMKRRIRKIKRRRKRREKKKGKSEKVEDTTPKFENQRSSSISSTFSSSSLEEEEEKKRGGNKTKNLTPRTSSALNMLNQLRSVVKEGNEELIGDD